MINVSSLTEADRGRWVEYCPPWGEPQRGRIQSWTNTLVNVVFRCGNWDDYQNYPGARSLPEHLTFIEPAAGQVPHDAS